MMVVQLGADGAPAALDPLPSGRSQRTPLAVALGTFDGVHLGHQALLTACLTAAADQGARAFACTFYPHPARVLRPAAAPPMLEPLCVRLARFAAAHIEGTHVQAFSAELAAMSPAEFFHRLLLDTLGARAVVVGENFRFGKKRTGDIATLHALGQAAKVPVVVVPPVLVDGAPASSSRVRNAVLAGDLAKAAKLLGRPFSIVGEVVQGLARGRTLGYPTANVTVRGDVLPPFGVYAAFVQAPRGVYRAAVSIGVHPTFAAASAAKVEAYLLDYPGESLYGSTIEVALTERLRPEQKFGGVDLLLAQMADDVVRTRQLLAKTQQPAFVPLAMFAEVEHELELVGQKRAKREMPSER